jgi:RNA polymerase sigma-70 factor (ECF subfamily)
VDDGVYVAGRKLLQGVDERERFEQTFLPHLSAAYNLARWLTRDDADADDLVQASYVRALKAFGGFRGTNSRAWLLTIVRNACYSWVEQKRARGPVTSFDEQIHAVGSESMDPEKRLLRDDQVQRIRRAVEELPHELREVVVLRELEGLSYKEIAAVAEIPMGTVMSRLARARERLRDRLCDGEDGDR